jgi:hypothetical protein
MASRGWPATIVVAVLVLAGCSSQRTFSAEEFVTQVKDQGVELELGQPLATNDPSKKIYALTLTEATGSLYVYEDTGAADDGMQACRAGGGLLCYQAGNVVVVLEEGGIEAQRLAVAIQKLAED